MAIPASIDKVVFIGASIINGAFGQDLTTPNSNAMANFRNIGVTGVDVYGYGFGGFTSSAILPKVQEAITEFGNTALYIVHIGGNDVSNLRPYATASSAELDQARADYQAVADALSGQEFILSDVSFRAYADPNSAAADAMYANDTDGSKPFNENVFLPIIQASVSPDYMMSNGVPITDFYQNTRNGFKFTQDTDGIHYTNYFDGGGYFHIQMVMLKAISYLFGVGVKPEPFEEVQEDPNTYVVIFSNEDYGYPLSRASDTDVANSASAPIQLLNNSGDAINLSISSGGEVWSGVGRFSGFYLPYFYNDYEHVRSLNDDGFYVNGGSTTYSLSGMNPSSEYKISLFGTRTAPTTNREQQISSGAELSNVVNAASGVDNLDLPAEPAVLTATSSEAGDLVFDVVATSGIYTYHSALTVEYIPPPLPTANAGPDLTATNGDTVTLSGATATNYDSLAWACTSGQSPTFSDATSLNPDVTFNEAGSHTLQLTATNTEGSVPDTLTATVEAIPDTTKPVITLLGNASVTITEGDTYTDAGATALDETDGDITADIVTVNPVDVNTAGSYTVTYNVTDAAGNAADEVTRSVTVEVVNQPPEEVQMIGSVNIVPLSYADKISGSVVHVVANKNSSNIHRYTLKKMDAEFDLDSAGITKIVIADNGHAISTEDGSVRFSNSEISIEWGRLDSAGNITPTFYFYAGSNQKAEVVFGPGMNVSFLVRMMPDERPA